MNLKNILSWLFRIAAAIILLQTLYFKFTAHPESVELFTKLGVEPWGRIGTGIIELITGLLLLIPATAFKFGPKTVKDVNTLKFCELLKLCHVNN